MDPIATIVIPTYNQRPEYLLAAVSSALEQTLPVEVVVVDDGSDIPAITGATPANVRVIRFKQNRGIAAALNAGIAVLKTNWFCWLSSDDVFDSNKIEVQLTETLKHNCLCSFHRYRIIRHERIAGIAYTSTWTTLLQQRRQLSWMCEINGSTTMIHRAILLDVGGFDESYRYGQDWECWNRVGRKYLWHPVHIVLGSRREGDNLTSHIEAEPEKRKIRDAEDRRIRETYRVEP